MLKTSTVQAVSVEEWSNFVEKTYGKFYDFQQQDGGRDRGTETLNVPCAWVEDCAGSEISFETDGEEMGVSFTTWLNTSPEDTDKHFKYIWENRFFWYRNFYPDAQMIANDLHSKGLLKEGCYMIVIDW